MKRGHVKLAIVAIALSLVLAAGGCQSPGGAEPADDAAPGALSPVSLQAGEKLRVVATTSLIADVVANVGGDRIELAQLIPTGADPHGFTPAPRDVRTLNDAHVIFINGLGLEESLLPVLENLDRPVPLVAVNDGIEVITLDEGEHEDEHAADVEHDHGHEGVDPHAWFSVPNVQVWTGNIAAALSALDPAQAEAYAAAAASYQESLDALDRELRDQIDAVPDEARKVATDHQALGYLRKEYGIEVVGRSYRRSRRWRPAQRRWPLQERALRRRASRPSREYNGEPADGEPAGAGPGIRVVLDLHRSLSEPGRAYCDHVELGAQQRVANGRLEALRQVPPSPRLAARSACSLSAPHCAGMTRR